MVEYTYDVWGKPISVTGTLANTIGQTNPIGYRGYYFDSETDFYYLQSRYYDAEIGRFLNADGVIAGVGGDVLGYNQFIYCFNNPVNLSDETGNWPKWVKNAVNKVKETVKVVEKFVKKASKVVSTKDFKKQVGKIVFNNIDAAAGCSIGLGVNKTIYNVVDIEATTRMDIVGVQLKEGKLDFGHPGRSSITIGIGPVSIGFQSDTYEDFGITKRIVYDDCYFDIGFSFGDSVIPFIGYHYDVSISLLGIFCDTIEYINNY